MTDIHCLSNPLHSNPRKNTPNNVMFVIVLLGTLNQKTQSVNIHKAYKLSVGSGAELCRHVQVALRLPAARLLAFRPAGPAPSCLPAAEPSHSGVLR